MERWVEADPFALANIAVVGRHALRTCRGTGQQQTSNDQGGEGEMLQCLDCGTSSDTPALGIVPVASMLLDGPPGAVPVRCSRPASHQRE